MAAASWSLCRTLPFHGWCKICLYEVLSAKGFVHNGKIVQLLGMYYNMHNNCCFIAISYHVPPCFDFELCGNGWLFHLKRTISSARLFSV